MNTSDEERREFLKEIQLMKDVGSHRNIVNMLGCGTLSDPMFLIVEYLPNGDLLHYLRKRRGKVRIVPFVRLFIRLCARSFVCSHNKQISFWTIFFLEC